MQQQASTSSETDLVQKQKKAEYNKFTRIGCTLLTCDMYMSDLRHLHDPVLSSLKMEGIRLLFLGAFPELRFAADTDITVLQG
jgi:hypothetical protein